MILYEAIEPTEGDYRVENCFAIFPTWVGNKRIWLQKYQNLWEYRYGRFQVAGTPCFRNGLGWVLIDQKVITKEPERHYH